MNGNQNKFQPSVLKEEIKQLLRDGVSVEECATKFPLSVRTIYRWFREVRGEQQMTFRSREGGLPNTVLAILTHLIGYSDSERESILAKVKEVCKVIAS